MFGAPKICARCDKQVYSIEELKCLDKIWHKGCFKCTVCNTTLNLKNYKGVDKLPYCVVHYPKQTHTAVNDNPELLRIKANTNIQSNAKYHADYERSKGKFTAINDDPEMRRVLENTRNISNIKYHENFEKKRANYTPIVNKNTQNSLINNINQPPSPNSTLIASYRSGENQLNEVNIYNNSRSGRIGSIADYDPLTKLENSTIDHKNTRVIYNDSNDISKNSQFEKEYQAMQQQLNMQKQILHEQQQRNNSLESNHLTLNKNSKNDSKIISNDNGNEVTYKNINGNNGHTNNINNQFNNSNISINSYYEHNEPNSNNQGIQTSVFKAIYDYDAKEDDEITFRDGDKFINCEQIDIGWMIGVHEKTGKHGMIPFNYTEPIDLF